MVGSNMKKINLPKKKVAVLGLGLEGQDLCQFLLKRRAKITVFDQKTASELGVVYKKLKLQGVKFKLGKDYLKESLTGWDFIFRSPGFYRFLPEIIEAEKKGVFVSSAAKLFFALSPARIIGVTGTKGKGTTASLIYQILKEDGRDVHLGGNIGQPMLSLLPKLKSTSTVVLELSSFQLMDFDQSPHIAVVLFITSEHLDYHKNKDEYIRAKANIVHHQKKGDFAILNADDSTSSSFASLTPAKIFCFSRKKKINGTYVLRSKIYLFDKIVGQTENLQLRGKHNWENVSAAILAASLVGAELKAIKKAVFSFTGLEHRLEPVRKFKGVEFYNDSFSTTPETAIAAIRAFDEPIILIAGGSEKGSDFTQLGKEISQSSVKTLILIGEMAGRIKKACQKAKFKGQIIDQPKNMKEIVKLAFQKAKPGDVILLSPACASFDMFKDYKDRGEQFKKYAKAP